MNFKKSVNGSWVDTPNYIYNTSTDTITTLPANLYADGNNATVGLVGNMTQTGTPSPDNPIQPQECGERTGNVMPSALAEAKELNGVTIACDGNGTYTVTGTATGNTEISFTIPEFTIPISVGRGGNGTLSFFNTLYNANARITIKFMNGDTLIDSWSLNTPNRTHTTYSALGGQTCNKITLTVAEGMTTNGAFAIMFTDDGQLPSTYEPYGIKIPISSANTTTPVYLGEVESERKIRLVRLTNPVAVKSVTGGNQVRFTISPNAKSYLDAQSVCNIAVWDGNNAKTGHVASNNSIYITQPVTEWETLEGATEWFNTHEVYAWYVLATPTTGIVNEPLRKIGDYADTVSGVSIPTIAGKDTFDVQTTLKPSEVTANYHGWHTGTVHERESGSWD